MPLTDREMAKKLKDDGWVEQPGQGKGSHRKFKKEGQKRPIILPKGELKKGTEQAILKQIRQLRD